VGKSVVATNLAYSLSALGLRVGLFDADLFGPSLPTLIARGQFAAQGLLYDHTGSSITPYTYEGVKTMSYGYASPSSSSSSLHAANVMRGPVASTLTRDLLTRTAWSSLDYLVIDCPPGTSDILLTLTQTASIAAAVVVTTPQRLAYVDVMKGLHMFASVQVEVVALVENMSWVRCGGCGEKRRVFGKGHMEEMRA
jgi:Mrp family chromosome partitioning ATPase